MWAVEEPKFSASKVTKACASKVRDPLIAKKALAAADDLKKNRSRLLKAIDANEVFLLNHEDFTLGELSDDESRWLYTNHIAKVSGGARDIYDRLINSARFGLCSYCQQSVASTLDHFVPKNPFGGLAIEPLNLIPACARCNHELGNSVPASAQDQLFHPYREGMKDRWLYAEVIENGAGGMVFKADLGPSFDELTQRRVKSQFDSLKLGELYAGISGRDIAEAKQSIAMSGSADAAVISEILTETAKIAFAVDENSLRGVIYEALSESSWFCGRNYEER